MNEDRLNNKKGYLNKDFQLFHLKDKKNMEFEFHYHDFNKIIIFISGKVNYLIEGKSYKLKPWDILLVSNNEVHKPLIDSSETYERIVIWVNSIFLTAHNSENCNLLQCFNDATKKNFNLIRLKSDFQNNIKFILKNLEIAVASNEFGSNILSNSLFIQMIVHINRFSLMENYILEENEDIEYNKTIEEILGYINNNLSENLSIDEIAAKFYISKYYLMHKFKNQTGYTLHNYILQKRLILANSLLKNDKSFSQISVECGFIDYSSFVRAFKKKFGASPKNHLTNRF